MLEEDFGNPLFVVNLASIFEKKNEQGISYANCVRQECIDLAHEHNFGPLHCENCQFYASKDGVSYGLCANCASTFGGPRIDYIDEDCTPVIMEQPYYLYGIPFIALLKEYDYLNEYFDCPICLESCPKSNSMILNCCSFTEHQFCNECILEWLKTTHYSSWEKLESILDQTYVDIYCPICRGIIEDISVIEPI